MSLINELLKQFQEITGVEETEKCLSMLRSNHWDVSLAVLKFYENDGVISHDTPDFSTKFKRKISDQPLPTTIKIRIILPDCKTFEEETYYSDENLTKLFNLIESKGFVPSKCRIYTSGSKRDLSAIDPNSSTFRILQFSSRETIIVELLDNVMCWYKRCVETLTWEKITANAAILEKAYLEHCASPLGYPLEIYFDDHADYVSIDFDKMVASAVYEKNLILYNLKRKNGFDGLPFEWDWDEKLNDKSYQLIELDRRSPEFISVSLAALQSFIKSSQTMPDVELEIEKIERIENPFKYKQFMKLKKELEQIHADRPDYVVERLLFHGTRPDNINSICNHGFNPTLSGLHGASHGYGCYFAKNFLLSLQYGNKIFYCNVLTGNYTKGGTGLKMAPDLDTQKGIKYDSVVDKVVSPEIFVVFSDNHAYPGYLITRKFITNGPLAHAANAAKLAILQAASSNVAALLQSKGAKPNTAKATGLPILTVSMLKSVTASANPLSKLEKIKRHAEHLKFLNAVQSSSPAAGDQTNIGQTVAQQALPKVAVQSLNQQDMQEFLKKNNKMNNVTADVNPQQSPAQQLSDNVASFAVGQHAIVSTGAAAQASNSQEYGGVWRGYKSYLSRWLPSTNSNITEISTSNSADSAASSATLSTPMKRSCSGQGGFSYQEEKMQKFDQVRNDSPTDEAFFDAYTSLTDLTSDADGTSVQPAAKLKHSNDCGDVALIVAPIIPADQPPDVAASVAISPPTVNDDSMFDSPTNSWNSNQLNSENFRSTDERHQNCFLPLAQKVSKVDGIENDSSSKSSSSETYLGEENVENVL